MSETRNEPDVRGRRLAVVWRAWAMALFASFLLAAPSVRNNEINEIGTAKEIVEDATVVRRAPSKRICLHVRHEVIVFASSIQARLRREMRVEPSFVDGHRLPNGLLAPMTC